MEIVDRIQRAYRWRRLLASCKLDLRRIERPLEPIGSRDFIVAGCPRTGTSLLAGQLFRPPHLVTVMEPWDGLRLPPAQLFKSLRQELAEGSLTRGRLDIDELGNGQIEWVSEGEKSYDLRVLADHALGVKWPTFWQYLDLLPNSKFVLTVRHPLETISSFERVGGRLASGLDYRVPFNHQMNSALLNATKDPAIRRALLYEYINSRLLPHIDRPNVLVVRYERWHTEPGRLLEEIGSFIGVSLHPASATITPASTREYPRELREAVRSLVPSASKLGYEV